MSQIWGRVCEVVNVQARLSALSILTDIIV